MMHTIIIIIITIILICKNLVAKAIATSSKRHMVPCEQLESKVPK